MAQRSAKASRPVQADSLAAESAIGDLRSKIDKLVQDYTRASVAAREAIDIDLMKLLRLTGSGVRADTARSIAGLPKCPPRTARALACDLDPKVAGEILRRCAVISEATLVELSLCGTQGHLLAIAERKHLADNITRTIVRRGDLPVLEALSNNMSALYSPTCRRRLALRLGSSRKQRVPSRVAPRMLDHPSELATV